MGTIKCIYLRTISYNIITMSYYDKYIKYKTKYNLLYNNLKGNRQNNVGINLLQNSNKHIQSIDVNDTNTINNITTNIKKYITEYNLSPKYKFNIDDDMLQGIINNHFKYKYIESLNGIIISVRQNLIKDALMKLNIDLKMNSINTLTLNSRINKININLTKLHRILDVNTRHNLDCNKLQLLRNSINVLEKEKQIMIYLYNYINKYFKIFEIDKQPQSGQLTGKQVETLITNKIINVLQDKVSQNIIKCDILYISNIDYNKIVHCMKKKIINNDIYFKQEIDGLVCIRLSNDTWLPIIILELKKNINLVYTDISKLNSLHCKLEELDDFTICDGTSEYNISSGSFKQCNLFYCVNEINNLIEKDYIMFDETNYRSKNIIFEIIMNEIKCKLENVNYFTNIEEVDNYIVNIMNDNSLINQKYDEYIKNKYDIIKNELYESLEKILKDSSNITSHNTSKSNSSNLNYNYFNHNNTNIDTFSYLIKKNIINKDVISNINEKLSHISNPFQEFYNREDTHIMLVK